MSDMVGKRINDLRVADLKVELDKRGLVTTGLKPILVKRLITALQKEGINPDTFTTEGDQSSKGSTPTKSESEKRNQSLTNSEDETETSELIASDPVETDIDDTVSVEPSAGVDEAMPPSTSLNLDEQVKGKDKEPNTAKPAHCSMDAMGKTAEHEDQDDHDALNLTIGEEDRKFGIEDEENNIGDVGAGASRVTKMGKLPSKDVAGPQLKETKAETKPAATLEPVKEVMKGCDAGSETKMPDKPAEVLQPSDVKSNSTNEIKNVKNEDKASPETPAVKKDTSKEEGRVVQVTGLSAETRAKEIRELFRTFGKILSVKIISSNRNGGDTPIRFAQVTMVAASDATKCLKLDRTRLHGRIIYVKKEKADKNDSRPAVVITEPSVSPQNANVDPEKPVQSQPAPSPQKIRRIEKVGPAKGRIEKTKVKEQPGMNELKLDAKAPIEKTEESSGDSKTKISSADPAKGVDTSGSCMDGLDEVSNHTGDGEEDVKKVPDLKKERRREDRNLMVKSRGINSGRKGVAPRPVRHIMAPRRSGSPDRYRRRSPIPLPRRSPPPQRYRRSPSLTGQHPYPRHPSGSFVYRNVRDRDREMERLRLLREREEHEEREREHRVRQQRELERQKREREVERRRLAEQEERNKIAAMEIQKEKHRVREERERLAKLQEEILRAELKRQKDERERIVLEREEALRKKLELERQAAQAYAQKRSYVDDYPRERDYERKKPHVEPQRYYNPYAYEEKVDKSTRTSSDARGTERYHNSSTSIGRNDYSRRESEKVSGRPDSAGRRDAPKLRDPVAEDKARRRSKYTPVRDVPAPARGKTTHSSNNDWDEHKRRSDPSRHGRVVPKTPPPPNIGTMDERKVMSSSMATGPSKASALRDSRPLRLYTTQTDGGGGQLTLGAQILHTGSYGDTSDAWMRRTASYVSSNIPTNSNAASSVAATTNKWMNTDSRGIRSSGDMPDRWVSGSGSTLASASRSTAVPVPSMVQPPQTQALYLHQSSGMTLSGSSAQYSNDRYDYKPALRRY